MRNFVPLQSGRFVRRTLLAIAVLSAQLVQSFVSDAVGGALLDVFAKVIGP